MQCHKNNLVKFHPPTPGEPTRPMRGFKTGRIVATNDKPAAVKIGPYAKDEKGNLAGPRRRRWVPADWVTEVVKPNAPGTKLNP